MTEILYKLLLFAVPFVAGLVAMRTGLIKNALYLRLLLSFGGAYLLALCFTHLMPQLYESDWKTPGIWVIGGFMLQILLEYLSGGVEHGHFHEHSSQNSNFPIALMIGLCVHSLIEGMPFGDHHHHHHHHDALLAGILIHKVPVAIVLVSMFANAKLSTPKIILWLAVFCTMSPLGTILYEYIEHNFDVNPSDLML